MVRWSAGPGVDGGQVGSRAQARALVIVAVAALCLTTTAPAAVTPPAARNRAFHTTALTQSVRARDEGHRKPGRRDRNRAADRLNGSVVLRLLEQGTT